MDLRDIADLRFANSLTKLVVSFFGVECNGSLDLRDIADLRFASSWSFPSLALNVTVF
jgi:hypothetical protein